MRGTGMPTGATEGDTKTMAEDLGVGEEGGGGGRGGNLGGRRGGPAQGQEDRIEPVDREKVCPMLLRLFCKFNAHHEDAAFSYKDQPLADEVRVHTWRDATFGELTELLAQVRSVHVHAQITVPAVSCIPPTRYCLSRPLSSFPSRFLLLARFPCT